MDLLGTVQNLFYDIAGAKRNGTTTFFELIQNWMNMFYKANMYWAVTFYEHRMKFET